MKITLLLIAILFFIMAIIIGSITSDSWKSTGYTWGFLIIGIILLGIVLVV